MWRCWGSGSSVVRSWVNGGIRNTSKLRVTIWRFWFRRARNLKIGLAFRLSLKMSIRQENFSSIGLRKREKFIFIDVITANQSHCGFSEEKMRAIDFCFRIISFKNSIINCRMLTSREVNCYGIVSIRICWTMPKNILKIEMERLFSII